MEVMLFSLKQIFVSEVHLRPRVRSTVPGGTGLTASSTGYTSKISCVCRRLWSLEIVHTKCQVMPQYRKTSLQEGRGYYRGIGLRNRIHYSLLGPGIHWSNENADITSCFCDCKQQKSLGDTVCRDGVWSSITALKNPVYGIYIQVEKSFLQNERGI